MGFVSFSSEVIFGNQTQIDNVFLNEFLPNASANAVKVYIYGLYKCINPDAYDNTIENFASQLNMSANDIEEIFKFWEEQGLVKFISTVPFEVKYMPVQNAVNSAKKYTSSKFADFNKQIQEIISGRMITPTEYNEYYYLLDGLKIEPTALIMIADYCVKLKGKDVGYKYIETVAKNWAYQSITTTQAVENKIIELQAQESEIADIFEILKIKRKPTVDDRELFNKWTKELDFDLETIIFVAKQCKKTLKISSFEKLDNKFMQYFSNKLNSIKEIEQYEKVKEHLYSTAKNVCKAIGVYYDNFDNVVETYILKWTNMGYEDTTILTLANYCFKTSTRTLAGLDLIVNKFYKLGLVSSESIEKYLKEIIEIDEQVKQILFKMDIKRNVNSWDREYYQTWKNQWFISDELIDFGCSIASEKSLPIQYLNRLLSTWHDKQVKTVEHAKKYIPENKNKKIDANFTQREYKKEDLNAMFSSLDEVEL